jgi:hypothetical protein
VGLPDTALASGAKYIGEGAKSRWSY